MVATTCPSAVADSLHAACSQTQRPTPRACGPEVPRWKPLTPLQLALHAHDGEEETHGPDA